MRVVTIVVRAIHLEKDDIIPRRNAHRTLLQYSINRNEEFWVSCLETAQSESRRNPDHLECLQGDTFHTIPLFLSVTLGTHSTKTKGRSNLGSRNNFSLFSVFVEKMNLDLGFRFFPTQLLVVRGEETYITANRSIIFAFSSEVS